MLRLVFTAPISTTSNEWAFSKLKMVKYYLRSTIQLNRLQNVMTNVAKLEQRYF
jgi:hypothetical protein